MGKQSIWKSALGAIIALVLLSAGGVYAQDDTTEDTTDTTPTSTINYFATLCEDRIVIELDGTMQSGYDVYYQAFSGQGGTGTALTNLLRVQVSGTYSVSDTAIYTGGTLPTGTVGSYYVAIGSESNSSTTLYSDTLNDTQDGCTTTGATTGATTSTDTGSSSSSSSSTTATGTVSDGQFADGTSAILSPFGGYLNPNYIPPDEPLVEIGAQDEFVNPRQQTPGLIFAECEDYPVAEPGIVYDTDNVIVFWSWYTATEAQILDHIANVDYSVTYYQTLELPNPQRSAIRVIDGNYWVFYYSVLGNLLPGRYYIEYKVHWDEPHFDGYDTYGPGTDMEGLYSGCEFVVLPNPEGRSVSHNTWPYQHGEK